MAWIGRFVGPSELSPLLRRGCTGCVSVRTLGPRVRIQAQWAERTSFRRTCGSSQLSLLLSKEKKKFSSRSSNQGWLLYEIINAGQEVEIQYRPSRTYSPLTDRSTPVVDLAIKPHLIVKDRCYSAPTARPLPLAVFAAPLLPVKAERKLS